MGVDFHGYSRVKSEPVPEKYRATRKTISEIEKQKFKERLLWVAPEYYSLILAENGISQEPNGELIFPSIIEHSPELQNEFYEIYEKQNDFIMVNWNTNTIYRRTPDTKECLAERSYSGYGDFIEILKKLNKGPMPYMPPSTDAAPESGLVTPDKCLMCLQGLDKLRNYFVSESWEPDHIKYNNHTHAIEVIDEPDNDIHQDSWFFSEFYTVMTLGADTGIVRIY
jgi:hypothetical protein